MKTTQDFFIIFATQSIQLKKNTRKKKLRRTTANQGAIIKLHPSKTIGEELQQRFISRLLMIQRGK